MKEVKLTDNLIGENHTRRFFAIKNEKGFYQNYSIKSKWTDKVSNANLYLTEKGATEEACRMLQGKENLKNGKDYKYFSTGFLESFEKLYVVELELKEK